MSSGRPPRPAATAREDLAGVRAALEETCTSAERHAEDRAELEQVRGQLAAATARAQAAEAALAAGAPTKPPRT